MAIWNNKFDRVNGETRECKDCGTVYHTHKPTWYCRLCTNRKVRESVKKNKPYEKKEFYPIDMKNDKARQRFVKIRQKLRKAWSGGREELTKHYSEQLREAEELGIMKWINDRRDKNSVTQRTASKSMNIITKDYPSTKGYYED